MLGLIGKKLGMTTIFGEDGTSIPVTVLEVGPCVITQIKDAAKDGYTALQIGYGEIKEKHLKKPQAGQFKSANVSPKKYLKEFRTADTTSYKVGQELKGSDIFQKGDVVDVTSISKGKGFQGVIRRHNFAGGPETHGSNFHRRPGSIGQCAWPSRVWKNVGMPGQMGNKRVTTQNLRVVDIREDDNLIIIKGTVPGARNAVIKLTHAVKTKKQKSS